MTSTVTAITTATATTTITTSTRVELAEREKRIQLKMVELLKKKEEAEIEAEARRRLAAKLHPEKILWNGKPLPNDLAGLELIRSELASRGIVEYKPPAGVAPLRMRDALKQVIRDAQKEGKLAAVVCPEETLWNGKPLPSDPAGLELVRAELSARGINFGYKHSAPVRVREGLKRAIRDARKEGKL